MALLTVSKESALAEAVNSVYRASVLGIVSSVVIQLGFRWFLRCSTQEGGGMCLAGPIQQISSLAADTAIIVLLVLSLSGHLNCSSSVV